VIAFDPHPQSVLAQRSIPERLTTFDERARLLRSLGADEVRRLEPDTKLLATPPEAFVEQVIRSFSPQYIVEGDDFRFGKARAGDMAYMAELTKPLGCAAITVPQVEVDLVDQSIVPVSSTMVRWLLSHGRVSDAARLLGRPYRYIGQVVRCDRRGRTIGFPTANIDGHTVMPANGIYACLATLPDGSVHPAAVNVGTRPTVDGHHRCVEAHILGIHRNQSWAPLPGLPEYGWPLVIDFIQWVRDEVRFDSVDILVEQMHRDCARIHTMIYASAGETA
jgi:riboflavin kinase/FMN adenylyltransferase